MRLWLARCLALGSSGESTQGAPSGQEGAKGEEQQAVGRAGLDYLLNCQGFPTHSPAAALPRTPSQVQTLMFQRLKHVPNFMHVCSLIDFICVMKGKEGVIGQYSA